MSDVEKLGLGPDDWGFLRASGAYGPTTTRSVLSATEAIGR